MRKRGVKHVDTKIVAKHGEKMNLRTFAALDTCVTKRYKNPDRVINIQFYTMNLSVDSMEQNYI